MREILIDPARTSVRLVVNPERMVIAEARRTYTYLSLFGYRVDAVVANRLLPDEVSDPWFDRWKELHVEHLKTIEDSFAPLPVLTVELAAEELVGVDALRALRRPRLRRARRGEHPARGPAAEDHPARRAHDPLPRAARSPTATTSSSAAAATSCSSGSGPYRRAITLPDSLRNRPVADASLKQGRLKVIFEGSAEDG